MNGRGEASDGRAHILGVSPFGQTLITNRKQNEVPRLGAGSFRTHVLHDFVTILDEQSHYREYSDGHFACETLFNIRDTSFEALVATATCSAVLVMFFSSKLLVTLAKKES